MSKEFKKLIELDKDTVMIVDALNLAFRYKHARKKNFTDDYINTVESLRNSYKAQHVIIACDRGSSTYRKEIYPEYKQQRKTLQETQTEQEKQEFEEFFEEFNNAMEVIQTKFPVLRFQGVEADDIAAYIVKNLQKIDKNVWLISSDRDWDLLVGPKVSRFSYVTRKEITYNNWNTHYDFEPDQYISIKCLMGDTGDNIKGVEGIGPKRAQELVQVFGSALDIYDSLPIRSKYKYISSLNNSGDTILLNYKLMDLKSFSEDAIGRSNLAVINKTLQEVLNDRSSG